MSLKAWETTDMRTFETILTSKPSNKAHYNRPQYHTTEVRGDGCTEGIQEPNSKPISLFYPELSYYKSSRLFPFRQWLNTRDVTTGGGEQLHLTALLTLHQFDFNQNVSKLDDSITMLMWRSCKNRRRFVSLQSVLWCTRTATEINDLVWAKILHRWNVTN